MDEQTRTDFENIRSTDRQLQNQAFLAIMAATDRPVEWAYEVWDDLLGELKDKDNHVRAIAAQVLCNLSKSDPQGRMLTDFPALLALTKDPRFVTARHCLQSLWKVGVVGPRQRELLLGSLEARLNECIAEKNCTIIRYDIIMSLRNVYDQVMDEQIRTRALALIETETNLKYRKKYMGVWK